MGVRKQRIGRTEVLFDITATLGRVHERPKINGLKITHE